MPSIQGATLSFRKSANSVTQPQCSVQQVYVPEQTLGLVYGIRCNSLGDHQGGVPLVMGTNPYMSVTYGECLPGRAAIQSDNHSMFSGFDHD